MWNQIDKGRIVFELGLVICCLGRRERTSLPELISNKAFCPLSFILNKVSTTIARGVCPSRLAVVILSLLISLTLF